jgi:hypothetical protein
MNMKVMCQIVNSDHGFEGVIQNADTGETVYNTGFQSCAEDADGLMEGKIVQNRWDVVPNPINER